MRSLPAILKAAASNSRLAENEKEALLLLAESIGARDVPDTGPAIAPEGLGRGTPYGRNDTVIDGTRALILDYSDVAMSDQSDGRRIAVLQFEGRINRSKDRATFALLVEPDGLAAVTTQIIGLMQRERGAFAASYGAAFTRRMAELP